MLKRAETPRPSPPAQGFFGAALGSAPPPDPFCPSVTGATTLKQARAKDLQAVYLWQMLKDSFGGELDENTPLQHPKVVEMVMDVVRQLQVTLRKHVDALML